jgi:hypothetical protein
MRKILSHAQGALRFHLVVPVFLLFLSIIACTFPGFSGYDPSPYIEGIQSRDEVPARVLSVNVSPKSGSGNYNATVIYTHGVKADKVICEWHNYEINDQYTSREFPSPADSAMKQDQIDFSFSTQAHPGKHLIRCFTDLDRQSAEDEFIFIAETPVDVFTVSVTPKSGQGDFSATVVYTHGSQDGKITCDWNNVDEHGPLITHEIAVTADSKNKADSTTFPLTGVAKPGQYLISCRVMGTYDSTDNIPFTVTGSCKWDVSGGWKVTQSNNYHPVFDITQNGTTLTGTATLSGSEAATGGFSSNVGEGTGSLVGDAFTFTVTWHSKKGGTVTGVYTGTVTKEGIVNGHTGPGTWSATGVATCNQ